MSQQLSEDISALEDLADSPDDPITLEQCRHTIDVDDDGIMIEVAWNLSYRFNQNIEGTHYRLRQFCGYQLKSDQLFPRTNEGWEQLVSACELEKYLAESKYFPLCIVLMTNLVSLQSLDDCRSSIDRGQMVMMPYQDGRTEFYANQDGYRVDVYADWDRASPLLEGHQFAKGNDGWDALLESWGNFLELAISNKKLVIWPESTIDFQARPDLLKTLASML